MANGILHYDDGGTASRTVVVERRHIYGGAVLFAFLSFVLTISAVVFRAGGTDGKNEQRLATLFERVQKIETDYARKDVVSGELANLKQSMQELKAGQDRTQELLNQILVRQQQQLRSR